MHVVLHGGAGSSPTEPGPRQRALSTAATAAAKESSPLAAVCTGVRELERDARFNAGVGSAVQSDGRIRTEAGVMTSDGHAGAAAGMPGVERAVDVARAVATETPHVLVAGDGAMALADAYDVPTDRDLWTERTRERWAATDPPTSGVHEQLEWVRERFGGTDTVGGVASDGATVAAATSTGGRWFALAGRVGDAPQVGAGVYADERGGASATGAGEAIAEFGLARRAVSLLDSVNPRRAATRAIRTFADETDEHAGVIVMDDRGRVGEAIDSEAMQTARAEVDD